MFLVLLMFALVKKKKYFKCSKHPNNPQEVATIGQEVMHLKGLMANKSGAGPGSGGGWQAGRPPRRRQLKSHLWGQTPFFSPHY